MSDALNNKTEQLKKILHETGSAMIALSGGTDSTFLVWFASQVGNFRLTAVTIRTPYMFSSETEEAVSFCNEYGINHKIIDLGMPEMIRRNPPERCYLCKKTLMDAIASEARTAGFIHLFDGTNADDMTAYRPGLRALKEAGVRSPLSEANLTKNEIRYLAHQAGLAVSDRPTNSCLLTRFTVNTLILPEDLRRVEKAEAFLSSMGFAGSRIRIHGDLVRIECMKEHLTRMMDEAARESIVSFLKNSGYRFITIDLEGYRSGSMDEKHD